MIAFQDFSVFQAHLTQMAAADTASLRTAQASLGATEHTLAQLPAGVAPDLVPALPAPVGTPSPTPSFFAGLLAALARALNSFGV